MNSKSYNVFISHASKDKLSYVDKLVRAIEETGLSVFYDTESIAWGDSISSKVEEGLNNCDRAVVVISKNFFDRKWTEYELMTLLQRQNSEGRKIIMPILHRITKRQFVRHYPELSDIKFKYSKNTSCNGLAKQLYEDINQN